MLPSRLATLLTSTFRLHWNSIQYFHLLKRFYSLFRNQFIVCHKNGCNWSQHTAVYTMRSHSRRCCRSFCACLSISVVNLLLRHCWFYFCLPAQRFYNIVKVIFMTFLIDLIFVCVAFFRCGSVWHVALVSFYLNTFWHFRLFDFGTFH